MNRSAVVLGAGQTGRGLVARLLHRAGYRITLVDRNRELVSELTERGSYRVAFFGDRAPPTQIDGFRALHTDDPATVEALAGAAVVFTAVAAQNLSAAAPLLARAQRERDRVGAGPMRIILCENGVGVDRALRELLQPLRICAGCAVVFCTCVNRSGLEPDILSEALDELPYDREASGFSSDIAGLVWVDDPDSLLRRKVYTYNCLNACIAIPGALRGHTLLSDAAADPRIAALVAAAKRELDRALGMEFGVGLDEQDAFSARAMAKFCNPAIADPVERNIWDLSRKLGKTERIAAPLAILRRHGADPSALELVAAAALLCGVERGELSLNLRDREAVTAFLHEHAGIPEPQAERIFAQIPAAAGMSRL